MTTELRFCLNEADVIFERFDEEIVAIQFATGVYHSISGAGIDAFLLLSSQPTAAEMAEALAGKYDASNAQIAADLGPFLEQLQRESLVVAQKAGAANGNHPVLPHAGARLPYVPPVVQPFPDLQELFFVDPVHDVGPVGWPQPKPDTAREIRYRSSGVAGMIFERLDDETVAMNLETGDSYNLTGPAEDIFLLLGEAATFDEIVQALRTKYAASQQDISEPTAKFLESLIQAGLAEQYAPESPVQARRLSLAKPGLGLAFVAPDLNSFHGQVAPAALFDGPNSQPRLAYARKRFSVHRPEVIVRVAGQEAIAINFQNGIYYLLNSSATNVLRLLGQKPTASELLEALGRLYDLKPRELTAAVLVLLHNLTREGLARVEEAGEESIHLDVGQCEGSAKHEPFSVQAYRELRHLFLPFQGTSSEKPPPSRHGPELVTLLAGYHAEVAQSGRLTEAVYRLAGHTVRVRCAGGLTARELGLAFRHLQAKLPEGVPADFTIQAWDCVSGGPPSHPLMAAFLNHFYPNWWTLCGPRGEVLAFHSPEVPVLYHAGPDILSVIDLENRTAYYLKRDASPLPYWEIGSPFRAILHFWFASQGLQFVHAGAIGGPLGGVMLVGKGGSGKSTTALACLNAGMAYAGDDYCAVALAATPHIHSLYNTAKLKGEEDLDRFPHLRDHVWNADAFSKNDQDKAIFFLSELRPDQMSAGFPLRAVLIPRITGERATRLEKCSEPQALLALAASTLAQLPMSGSQDLERLGNLVGRLPHYTLFLGTDLTQIPGVIQSVL